MCVAQADYFRVMPRATDSEVPELEGGEEDDERTAEKCSWSRTTYMYDKMSPLNFKKVYNFIQEIQLVLNQTPTKNE